MVKTRLGRTGLMVTRTAFGVLPLQRVPFEEAERLLRRAYEGGMNFYDTARGYSDSEEKIGRALGGVRGSIVIASKSPARSRAELLRDLEVSLRSLRTHYVDLYQLHNPEKLPDPADPDSPYAGLMEARRRGSIRFAGISNHRRKTAEEAAASGLYDTVQFPLSHISSEDDLGLVETCRRHDVGLIAMKALCGGLVTNAAAAFAFLRRYDNVVPIWGIQRESELEQFLALDGDPPALDETMWRAIEKDRRELSGDFCRGCGYCLPCPAEIPINMAARMAFLLRRAPYRNFITGEWQEKMRRIERCTECGQCGERCPYGLDTPALLRKMLADYEAFLRAHAG